MLKNEKLGLSAVILTLNEEKTVGKAIKSLAWCEEVFIVDSGSSDKTTAIAESLGAKVYVNIPKGDFLITEQRNWALRSLPFLGKWVLFLDADEESTEAFRIEVSKAITSDRCDAFYAAPAFMYYGRWLKRISGYPNWHPRIVKIGSCITFTGGVWEDFSTKELAGKINAPYIHETNAKGLEDWLEKHVRYAKWESSKILETDLQERTTGRRKILRNIRYRLGGLRKYISIIYLAIGRRGLLDGREGRSYLRRMFIYELLIDEFQIQESARGER